MASETMEHQSNAELWEGGKSPFGASYGKLMMWYFLLSDAFTFAGFLIAYGALRFSVPSWPLPDFVFSLFPFAGHTVLPLVFVTFMTFKKENMSLTQNPFGRHTTDGVYIDKSYEEVYGHGHEHHDDHGGGGHDHHSMNSDTHYGLLTGGGSGSMEFKAGDSYLLHKVAVLDAEGHQVLDEKGNPVKEWYKRKYKYKDSKTGKMEEAQEELGPKAFGGLFFFITGFHGFHVFSGVVFLIIVMLNVMSGIYEKRKNGYEMVEKIGLYWHFVDLVWVFVFLVFYLL